MNFTDTIHVAAQGIFHNSRQHCQAVLVTWQVVLSKRAVKDARKLSRAGLRPHAQKLLELLADDPFSTPPHFEKLVGNLSGFYSRRINIQHRLIYRVDRKARVVHALRMWTHYE